MREFTAQPITEETDRYDRGVCAAGADVQLSAGVYDHSRDGRGQAVRALVAYAGGQEWVRKAPLVLLFCADLHRLDVLVKPEDKNVLHNTELYTVSVIDAALAAQKALIAAQALGLGGVVVGGVRNETEKMAQCFALPGAGVPDVSALSGLSADAAGTAPAA